MAILGLLIPSPSIGQADLLDFLIGEWTLETTIELKDGSRKTGCARLSVSEKMNGLGILWEERHFRSSDCSPQDNDYFNMCILHYDKKNEQWEGGSVNTLGNRKEWTVALEEEKVVIEISGEMFSPSLQANRMIFEDISEDRFSVTR